MIYIITSSKSILASQNRHLENLAKELNDESTIHSKDLHSFPNNTKETFDKHLSNILSSNYMSFKDIIKYIEPYKDCIDNDIIITSGRVYL